MEEILTFNGRTYQSVDAMPPEVRHMYERLLSALPDVDGDGVPDVLQGRSIDVVRSGQITQIVANGQVYSSVDDMPLDLRQAYVRGMQQIDRDQDGIPDAVEEGLRDLAARTQRVPGRLLIVIGAVIVVLVFIVGLFIIFQGLAGG